MPVAVVSCCNKSNQCTNGLVEQLKDKFPSAVTYIQFPFYAHLNVLFLISNSKFNIRQLSSNVRQKSYDGRHRIESRSEGCILYETWLISYKSKNKKT